MSNCPSNGDDDNHDDAVAAESALLIMMMMMTMMMLMTRRMTRTLRWVCKRRKVSSPPIGEKTCHSQSEFQRWSSSSVWWTWWSTFLKDILKSLQKAHYFPLFQVESPLPDVSLTVVQIHQRLTQRPLIFPSHLQRSSILFLPSPQASSSREILF